MSKKEVEKKLNPRRALFCKFYVSLDFHGTNAALAAGYSKKTAYSIANQLLKLQEVQSQITVEIEQRLKIRKGELRYKVLKELNAIAFADITNDINVVTEKKEKPLYDSEGKQIDTETVEYQVVKIKDTELSKQSKAISSIKQNEKGAIEIKYYDKEKALEKLGGYAGLWNEGKLDVNVSGEVNNKNPDIDYSKLTDEEAKKLFFEKMNGGGDE